jgi:hypothetical protein
LLPALCTGNGSVSGGVGGNLPIAAPVLGK